MLFRQLMDTAGSHTYTYFLADEDTKDAIIIDPVVEMVERDLQVVDELGLKLKHVLNTHCHADHITGSGKIKKLRPGVKSIISKASGAQADIHLEPGDEVQFGKHKLLCRPTPGHTNGCMTFIAEDKSMAFTGDALLIRGCGRTDFQHGCAETLYASVHNEIFTLPDSTLLCPAHDYKGWSVTTVKEEKIYNPRLSKSKEEFVYIMEHLNLPYPKKIDASLPANLVCGIQD